MLLTCQAIFGEERAAELAAFVEQATGESCPCWHHDRPCPLAPDDRLPVEVPAPRLRDELGELRVVASAALAGYGLVAMKIGSVF